MKRALVTGVLLAAVSCLGARAEGPDAAATAAELKTLLAEYDKADGGNTIPIEQAIIRLRDLKASAELGAVIGHKRFGFLATWALSEIGDAASGAGVLAAFKSQSDANGRIEMALAVGAFATDEVRTALRAEIGKSGGPERDSYRAALLRTRDAAFEKETLTSFEDKDPAKCAAAMLLIGDSRREDLLPRIAALAKDGRAVPGDRKSSFGVETVTKTANGMSSSITYPALKTLGDYAVEAASRCVSPTTPAMVAWWYETEIAPRFPAGPDGAALLAASAAAAVSATKAKAQSMREAIAAVIGSVRAADAESKLRITSVAFGDRWEIRYRLGGGMGAAPGAEKTATVDGAGKVGVK